jgi:hypothetical protein
MVRGLILSITLASLTTLASAQTSDAGADASLSPSLAAVAKSMHATIRPLQPSAVAFVTWAFNRR